MFCEVFVKEVLNVSWHVQKKVSCSHTIDTFDSHGKYAWCREKGLGVRQLFTEVLTTFHRVKKTSLLSLNTKSEKPGWNLVYPKEVTVMDPMKEKRKPHSLKNLSSTQVSAHTGRSLVLAMCLGNI